MPDTITQLDPWGSRARDWAAIEDENSRPLFDRLHDLLEVGEGTRLLDIGCGSGLAAHLAARRGSQVAGLDSSPGMIELARERTPDGDFRVGDMGQPLPWEDASFDGVTLANTLFFSPDPAGTLREIARVLESGGHVAFTAWVSPEEVELAGYVSAVAPLLPADMPALELFAAPGAGAEQARAAGLVPQQTLELDWSWTYPDLRTLQRGLLSPGLSALAIANVGEQRVGDAIAAAFEPLRTTSGEYRVENRVECTVARRES
jgi:SAM-dependent methyltransferase